MKPEFDALIDHLLTHDIFLGQAIELVERKMIERALERSGGRQTVASKMLGIHRNTLQRKMSEYEIGNGRPRRKPPAPSGRSPKRKSGAA